MELATHNFMALQGVDKKLLVQGSPYFNNSDFVRNLFLIYITPPFNADWT